MWLCSKVSVPMRLEATTGIYEEQESNEAASAGRAKGAGVRERGWLQQQY
jgi:hypothetical protein